MSLESDLIGKVSEVQAADDARKAASQAHDAALTDATNKQVIADDAHVAEAAAATVWSNAEDAFDAKLQELIDLAKAGKDTTA